MRDVVTLTMNPALDLSTEVESVVPFSKLRCGPLRRDPGGGGINVARIIRRLGGSAAAVFPVGGGAGEVLSRLLAAESVDAQPVCIAGETREDFTVFERSACKQYRFVTEGPVLSESEWRACVDRFADIASDARFAVVSGSLPPGVPLELFAEAARRLRQSGAKLVLDTTGQGLHAAMSGELLLIKPNLHEFSDLTGTKLSDGKALARAAEDLVRQGHVQAVALTLAADGAILATPAGAWLARPPQVEIASTVGAGDSFLGGMIWSLAKGKTWPDALRMAVAAGTAALLVQGTGLARPEDIDRLLPRVSVEEIACA